MPENDYRQLHKKYLLEMDQQTRKEVHNTYETPQLHMFYWLQTMHGFTGEKAELEMKRFNKELWKDYR
jgi:hypothetical protein